MPFSSVFFFFFYEPICSVSENERTNRLMLWAYQYNFRKLISWHFSSTILLRPSNLLFVVLVFLQQIAFYPWEQWGRRTSLAQISSGTNSSTLDFPPRFLSHLEIWTRLIFSDWATRPAHYFTSSRQILIDCSRFKYEWPIISINLTFVEFSFVIFCCWSFSFNFTNDRKKVRDSCQNWNSRHRVVWKHTQGKTGFGDWQSRFKLHKLQ